MKTINTSDCARESLKGIAKLKQGWGYSPDQCSPPFQKEFINYCSDILESIISTFGETRAPYVFPIVGGKTVQLEYDTDEFGYLEFEINQNETVGVFYIERETPQGYDDYDEKNYTKDVKGVITDCIGRYFSRNLYHNLPATKKDFMLIPPGETILDVLTERNIPRKDFLQYLSMSDFEFDDLIIGKKRIDDNVALTLYHLLGVPESFWLNLQSNYDKEVLEYGKVFRSTKTGNKQMDEK